MLPTERFLSFIREHQLFSQKDKVLLALSGGCDSVLLAHLFNAAGLNFGIAHCNFGLRDDESDGDERFAKELADRLDVRFHQIRFDTTEFAKRNKISVQMAARELRYAWFEQVRQESGYHCIAVAHHLSDTTETVLLNLTRGTGISGLHGILPKRGNLVRPLLFLNRNEIDRIVLNENIPYREDRSNFSSKYARNKIRLEVIPKLKEINPALDDTFQTNSRRFLQLEEFLDRQVNAIREKLFLRTESGDIEINLHDIKQLNPLPLLLFELFKPFGFSEQVLADLVSAWHGNPGKIFESAAYQLILDRGKLLLTEKKDHVEADEVLIFENDLSARFKNMEVKFSISDIFVDPGTAGRNMAFFDFSMLQFPLKMRQWKTGDYFYPFGMQGRKKLSDFFTGLKIPLNQKKKVPLLVNANGDILWVIGYRSDNRYKVGPQTKKVITFEKS